MQLSGALFLFLFLPLSFLLALPVPRAWRPAALALLSALWYVLANWHNPWGMTLVAVLVLLTSLLALHPARKGKRAWLALGVGLPLGILVAARTVIEYTALPFVYPMGLGFLTLGAISVAVDAYRGDTERRPVPETAGYLLFFPALTMGPVLRHKDFVAAPRTVCFSLSDFCLGIRLYMAGFIKRLVAAATLYRALEQILGYADSLPLIALLFLLPFAYFFFYFFVSGSSDLARGVSAMYGVRTQDELSMLTATSPDRMLTGALGSLHAYLTDYVGTPLRRLCGRAGQPIAALATVALTVLFFRTRAELLLLALPLLLSAVLSARGAHAQRRITRILLCVLSAILCAGLMLALLFDTPFSLFSLFGAPLSESAHFLYYVFGSVSSTRYLILSTCLLVCYLIATRLAPHTKRGRSRLRTAALLAEWILLFVGFALALLYFMPQFPQYADHLAPSPLILGGA
ncbi:MAG: hypothetical protein IJA78_03370 [Clostridia bacterium]|nr:hypothetical protein [Clostridia bacterium]